MKHKIQNVTESEKTMKVYIVWELFKTEDSDDFDGEAIHEIHASKNQAQKRVRELKQQAKKNEQEYKYIYNTWDVQP